MGVAGHCGVDVIVVVGVAGGTVEPGGLAHRGLAGTADELGLGMSARCRDLRGEDLREGFPGAGDSNADEIHERLLGDGSGV